jgi:hypothetical protein
MGEKPETSTDKSTHSDNAPDQVVPPHSTWEVVNLNSTRPNTRSSKRRAQSPLKMTLRKVSKTNSDNNDNANKTLQGEVKLNTSLTKMKTSSSSVKTDTVLIGRAQPFRSPTNISTSLSTEDTTQSIRPSVLTGKTGQPLGSKRGGKLKLIKRASHITASSLIPVEGVTSGTRGIEAQAGTSATPDFEPQPGTSTTSDISTQPSTSRGHSSSGINLLNDTIEHNDFDDIVAHVESDIDIDSDDEVHSAYALLEHRRRYVIKYGVEEIVYKVKFNDEWEGRTLNDIHGDMYSMFETVLNKVKAKYDDGVRCRVYLRHDDLQHDKPLFIALRPITTMTADTIMNALIKILNSNQTLKIDKSLIIHIGIMDLPRGGGFKKLTRRNAADVFNEKFEKRSILVIPKNKEQPTCAARAVIVAMARLKGDKNYNNIRNPKRPEQYKKALELLRTVNLNVDKEIEIRDFHHFETELDVQIIIYNRPFSNGCIYPGERSREAKIFLYYEANHFDVITSITGFLARSYFCTTCLVPYTNKKKHSCEVYCKTCENGSCITVSPLVCRECQQLCRGPDCFLRHKTLPVTDDDDNDKGLSLCNRYFACHKCTAVFPSIEKETHICHSYICQQCNERVSGRHLCYMRATAPRSTSDRFLYFDFECTVENSRQCVEGYKKLVKVNCEQCIKTGHECVTCSKCINCDDRSCNSMIHEPNFVVAQTVCKHCEDSTLTPESKCPHCGTMCATCWRLYKKSHKTYDCRNCPSNCGLREVVFKGDNTLSDFAKYLFKPQHENIVCLAHNGGRYDYTFLLDWILSETYVDVRVVYSGAQIKSINIPTYKMRLVDSLLFFPMPLRKLPKCFGLECLKGDFPHLFNLKSNYNYIGPYPQASCYDPDSMSKERCTAFFAWHADQDGKIFNFQKEILDYCRGDVNVLREACTKFRQMMMTLTADKVVTDPETSLTEYIGAVDPFISTTLAGLCLNVFRTKYLDESYSFKEVPYKEQNKSKKKAASVDQTIDDNTVPVKMKNVKVFEKSPIGIIPTGGYCAQNQFSRKSLLWIELMSRRTGYTIQHALNSPEGEYRVGEGTKYRVDGWCKETNTIYEFYGDVWHGCPEHTSEMTGCIGGIPPAHRYAVTIDRMIYLKKLGYKFVSILECEFDKMYNKLEGIDKLFLEQLDFVIRLDIRKAFYGGRTNCIVLHYIAKLGEIINYFDVTSLYPYVQKVSRYPLGHPIIITNNFGDIREYFGFAQVRVLPPRRLYHPVLPYRATGKLKFPLCRKCSELENINLCQCSDADRAFVGTFVTPELHVALDHGYTVVKIFEVLHYEESTQYDPETKSGGLFTPYVNGFVKLKTEASGFPEYCVTIADKKKYVADFYEKEGIQLDYDKIEFNPGLRLIAKSLLNNLWGRLGLTPNLPQTTFVRSPESFLEIVNDTKNIIKDFHIVNDNIIALVHERIAAAVPEDPTASVAIAAFTTAYGRLELYKYLDMLGERVLYFDTDSVIFKSSDPTTDPPLSPYLGGLTSELAPGSHIVEFASSGPKSYGYITNTGETACKIKGFSLNYTNSLKIDFSVIKDMVVNQQIQGNPDLKTVTTVNERQITRNKFKNIIYNTKGVKKYRACYTKRIIRPDLTTVPYGYDFSRVV